MKTTILRQLIREVITASGNSSPTPSTSTAPDSSPADKDDGGDQTAPNPKVAIEKYFRDTKNATDVKRDEEIKKLADTLKDNNVSTPNQIMDDLKALDRDEEGGLSFAQKVISKQT